MADVPSHVGAYGGPTRVSAEGAARVSKIPPVKTAINLGLVGAAGTQDPIIVPCIHTSSTSNLPLVHNFFERSLRG